MLRALPALQGGNNSQAAWVNNRGQIIGYSENGTFDATCATATPFQVTQFEAVIWNRNGEIRQLQLLKGDSVACGFGINDEGQAIGSSGLCSINGNVHAFLATLVDSDRAYLEQ